MLRGVVESGGSAGDEIGGAIEDIDIGLMGFGVVVIGAGESARGVIDGRIALVEGSRGSSVRESTVTSAKVVVGGSLSSTVRKVSWK